MSKVKILHFDGLLLSKAYKVLDEKVSKSYVSWHKYYVWAKKSTEELCVITLKNDAKFEEELTSVLKNDMRNFDSTLESPKIYTLMDLF